MYNLESGKYNNSETIKLINKNDDNLNKCLNYISDLFLTDIAFKIFKCDNIGYSDNLFKQLSIILTLGDELKIPISKNLCDLLWFSLLLNCNEKNNCHINNFSQAKAFYEYSYGDFTKIYLEEDDRKPEWIEISQNNYNFSNIVPNELKISFKIPLSHFKNKETNSIKYLLSGIDHCLMELKINGQIKQFKIMRNIYIHMFENCYKNRIDANNLDEACKEFSKLFNFNSEIFTLCLLTNGFDEIAKFHIENNNLDNFKYYNGNLYTNDLNNINENDRYLFKLLNDKNFILLPKFDFYIPLLFNNMYVIYV